MLARAGRSLLRLTFDNPVLLKELRIGLRERRIFVVQIGFLLILGSTCLLALASMLSNNDPQSLPQHGAEYFEMLFWVQLLLLLLVTPGLTCGSLSGERERHSLDMVMASRLTTGELAAGKLGFAMYYVVLLLSSSLPMASVVFFLGGVSPMQAVRAYFELGCWALLSSQIGLFYSARETRSNYATSQSYLLIILSMIGLFPYAALRSAEPVPWGPFTEFHPLYIVAALAAYFSLFLFVKTMHRLRPRAFHIKVMGWSFILIYGLLTALMLCVMYETLVASTHLSSDWHIAVGWLVGCHLIASGVFLNDTTLDSPREQALFRKSPLSRPMFWLIFLSVGLLSPSWLDLAMGNADQHFQLHLSLGLGVVYLLSLALFVRGLQKVLPGEPRFAMLYFVVLALLCSLPTLGLLSEDPGLLSGVYLSPFISISSIWEPRSLGASSGLADQTLAGLSVGAYMALAAVGAVLPMFKRKKK